MLVAVTGATGFIGRYIVRQLIADGHSCRAWHRATSDRSGFDNLGAAGRSLEWVEGDLSRRESCPPLVAGADAVVHAALYHPGGGFRGGEGDLLDFVEQNVVGSLALIEAARAAGVRRFVQISTCAVHEKILEDRPLDETQPTWTTSHYGASKAAIEQFVYSFGLGQNYPICALRPCGVYGVNHPVDRSKWHRLIGDVVAGRDVTCTTGGKEVFAGDVARAVNLLLMASDDAIKGQVFNCCDQYVAELQVATLAREIANAGGQILGHAPTPKHQIVTGKLQSLGMRFSGRPALEATVRELVAAARR